MDLSKIQWRDGALMLGLKSDARFTRDPAFEFDAPMWCDFSAATSPLDEEAERQADIWFAMPHPLHNPAVPTPQAEPLLDPSEYSPYKSPAPNSSRMSKVSPGPVRMNTMSITPRRADPVSSRQAKKGGLTSPIAMHPLPTSMTPMKRPGAPGVTPHKTPLKLLSDSAGKARLVLKTPGSASRMAAGPQRVVSNLQQRMQMQFEPIEENTAVPMQISPDRSVAAATTRTRAKRVSTVHVPPPSTTLASSSSSAAAAIASASTSSNLFSSGLYAKSSTASSSSTSTAMQIDDTPSLSSSIAPSTAASTASSSMPPPPPPVAKVRRAASKLPPGAVTAPTAKITTTVATTTTTRGTRKRRSAEVATTEIEMDPELAALLSKHNKQVAQEQEEDSVLAEMLEQHNRNLLKQQLPQAAGMKSPPSKSSTTIKSPTRQPLAPTSANKQPRKKMKLVAVAAKTNSGLEAAVTAATTTTTVRPKTAGAVLSKVASSTALTSRLSRTSPSSRSRSKPSSQRSSAENMPPPPALTGAVASTAAPMDTSFGVSAQEDEHAAQGDISFSVDDLIAPDEQVKKPKQRKSMGKALRAPKLDDSLLQDDEDVSDSMQIDDPSPSHVISAASVAASIDDVLDDLIVLDEPTPKVAPAPAPKRIQAAVSFTAATVTAKTSRATTATTATTRKSAGTSVLAPRSTNVPVPAPGKSKSLGAKVASSKPTPAASIKRPSTAVVATSRNKYTMQSTAVLAASSLLSEDDEIAALLAQHNNQFKPKVRYVPRQFSTAQIKVWENQHGRKWHELNAEERESANLQIAASLTT